MLYFEDFTVGQKFLSGPVVMAEDEMIAFARKYDPQIYHIDPEAAKDTFFKGLAASGWHTAAVTMSMMVDGWKRAGAEFIGKKVEFIEWRVPVRPGDSLSVTVEIIDIFPTPSGKTMGEMRIRSTTLNQKGEIAQLSEALVKAGRKAPAP